MALSLPFVECKAAVSITDDGAPSSRYAAEELRNHLKKLNLAEPDMRFSIGLSGDLSLGDDGFEIKSADSVVAVRGGRRGVIYGVYELLERYGGVMWLSPECTHIPTNGLFSVPSGISLRERPAFDDRVLDTFNYHSQKAFSVRSRLNEETFAEKFGGAFPPFDAQLWKCHTFLKMIPPEKYYDAHPEYFSLVKGKRLKVRPQLCLTNPDVFELVLSNVLARIEANARDPVPFRRTTRYYGVSQADWNNYCECENCAAIDAQEESHAGCVIWFVNKIAEAVEKKHPDVAIETLAYMYSRKPPKNLKPRDNVMICLCSIECDFSKPMTDSRYKENIAFRDDLLKWRDIAKNLYIWDYAANWRATPVPYPNLTAYAENVRFYHEAGVRYLFEEGIAHPAASFTDLKGWLGAKLMWNPHQPAEPLVRRFCEAYYGKGAPFVLAFIKFMGDQEIDEAKTPLTYAVPLEKMPFTSEFYEKGRELWVKAESAVADEPEQIRRHVAWGRFGLEYALAARYAQMGAWRAVNMSSNLATRLDRTEFLRKRECARYCQRLLDSDSRAMVSSRLNDFRLKGYLRALAEAEFPDATPSRALIQDWALNYDDFPKSRTISRIKENDATDRSAIRLSGEKSPRSLICHLKPLLAADRGARYGMRARIKARRSKDTAEGGKVLSVRLFDRASKKDILKFDLSSDKATGAYEWYDIGEWVENGNECVLYVDTYGGEFSIDCMEIQRLPDVQGAESLLTRWCDAMVAHQLSFPQDRGLDGAMVCSACAHLHGRIGDAVYPLVVQWSRTGRTTYLTAARKAVGWCEANMLCENGEYQNDLMTPWTYITVFSQIAIGRTLRQFGDGLPHDFRAQLEAIYERQSRWLYDNLKDPRTRKGGINYLCSYAEAMAEAGHSLKQPKYLEEAEKAVVQIKEFIAKDGMLTGEVVPLKFRTPGRGLDAVDVGYNLEEAIPAMLATAEELGDKAFDSEVVATAKAQLEFMLPDGAIDNTAGSRAYKWTYSGSRTADGVLPLLAMLEKRGVKWARRAAERVVALHARLTGDDGLLYGGLYYRDAGEPACLHHTFTHAKALAEYVVMTADSPRRASDEPMPRERANRVVGFPTMDVELASVGPWRATFSASDACLVPKYARRFSTGGGSPTLLWHDQAGLLLAATQADFFFAEPTNQQETRKERTILSTTPRLETADGFTNVQDFGVRVKSSFEDGVFLYSADGALTSLKGEKGAAFSLGYRLDESAFSVRAKVAAPCRFYLPVVGGNDTRISVSGSEATIERGGVRFLVKSSVPLNIRRTERGDRSFTTIGGIMSEHLYAELDAKTELSLSLAVVK